PVRTGGRSSHPGHEGSRPVGTDSHLPGKVITAVSFRKGKEAMRRFLLSILALTFLWAFVGWRCVGGVCDCYGYCCYPPCYGRCATGHCGMGNGDCGHGGCGGGANGAGPITPGTPAMPYVSTTPTGPGPSANGGGETPATAPSPTGAKI